MLKGLIQGITAKGFSKTRTHTESMLQFQSYKNQQTRRNTRVLLRGLLYRGHGGCSDPVTARCSTTLHASPPPPYSDMIHRDQRVLIFTSGWFDLLKRIWGEGGYDKVNLLQITTASPRVQM